ncbi:MULTISPECIES: AraC family transcriptional regulator [unclassified Pseudomonas]|jgi:AraC-like DNA-binding protein|uniref:AraC family transcriptional regulator n=1 Tax=unclassified Pseudomonas TaxID=196821 RepID=UPI000C883C69|nr:MULTISPECIES: AraC family transcriptional regulator [unclassified Pseudomonas]PNA99740.1 AraC family transcriptional regulator [Pseudomonas sp. GW460-5]PNB59427.1 AraC family transcriptional regulator [Pseudomonas sp. FW305-130]
MIEVSRFWRDPALPFVEARRVGDGRQVCYAAHSHESFSIGVITGGRSTYLNGDLRIQVGAGTTVLMNPGVVHACNPIDAEPWSYLMLFVDMSWLQAQGFKLPTQTWSSSPALYQRLLQGFADLFDAGVPDREGRLAELFGALPDFLGANAQARAEGNPRLSAAAAFIRAHRTDPLSLEDICTACGLSRAYLIRAFRQHYGLTPHGYLLDQRVQLARAQLRQGRAIAEVAQEAGFADQAHLQRAFKKHLAATPGHYRNAAGVR